MTELPMPCRIWRAYEELPILSIEEAKAASPNQEIKVNVFREFEYRCFRCNKFWYQVSKNSEVPPEPVRCARCGS